MAARGFMESPRCAADVLAWLSRRQRRDDLRSDAVLEAIRASAGVVPLGGRVGGADGATPPATPRRGISPVSGTTATSADGKPDENARRWALVTASCLLPVSVSPEQLKTALETLATEQLGLSLPLPTDLAAEKLWERYYAERRDFLAVRIELLRVARCDSHPSAAIAAEVVDELLQEGLREALLDELHGRQYVTAPAFFALGSLQRRAQTAWELQLLAEEALVRELLLLTLVASQERASLPSAVTVAKTVAAWEFKLFGELFAPSTLATTIAQDTARRVTQLGVLVTLRMLQSVAGAQQHAALTRSSASFFLSELCDGFGSEDAVSPVPGVVLLGWGALLGRQYRQLSTRDQHEKEELETLLQRTLEAVERLHGFHFLNVLLRSLVFRDDGVETEASQALLRPVSVSAKTLWKLPSVAGAGVLSAKAAQALSLGSVQSVDVFQQVAASFLNEMLTSLGYLESLESVQQLHAMVKLMLPVLANAQVAKQTLGMKSGDDSVGQNGRALSELLQKARSQLPQSILPCLGLYTALSCNYEDVACPDVLHHILKEFGKPLLGLEASQKPSQVAEPRQLPPDEYFRMLEDEKGAGRVECTRSFAYDDEDGRLEVAAGTIGVLVDQSMSDVDVEYVQWLVPSAGGSTGHVLTLWDLLMLHTDGLATGLQSTSLLDLHRTNANDVDVLTAFFEFIVQLGRQQDGGQVVIEDLGRRWGEARLRRWWLDHDLPAPELYIPLFVGQQIALPTLLAASREDLVVWGVRDRYTREQILAYLGGGNGGRGLAFGGPDLPSTARHRFQQTASASSSGSFTADGVTHLLRVLLGVLDGFLNARPSVEMELTGDNDSVWGSAQLNLVAASLSALRSLLATSVGVDLLMETLGGGREECVNLVVKSAKKLFDLQERLMGEYPVMLAALEIFMSVTRWFLAQEARALATHSASQEPNGVTATVGTQTFVDMERNWFVGAAEFGIEVLRTHESWKFATITGRCEVAERSVRLLFVLVAPRKYVHEKNEMLPDLETALRQTLATDTSLLIKLLRSSCAVLSTTEGHVKHWNSIAINGYSDGDTEAEATDKSESESKNDGHFPLIFESEPSTSGVSVMQLESLVTTCLRLLALLLDTQSEGGVDARMARQLLLTPIDDGGPKKEQSLTVVTLCGGYLAYALDKTPALAYWSLQILQHAAVVLDSRQQSYTLDSASTHSLVASLFQGQSDLPIIRESFARLLRGASAQHQVLRKEIVVLLTLCLDFQPGFLALLLFSSHEDDKDDDALPFVALLERFFVASEQLLEQASDLFCALLSFLVQVWKGAIHEGLGVHLQIMAALRKRTTFWPNVTRALKIRMPLESEEECGPLDMELVATGGRAASLESPISASEAYVGRSSAYGYLARGLILQLVSYEWHYLASRQDDHPLVQVLEDFRVEGLYAHWLRTFTRLDYSSARLAQHSSPIQRFCRLREANSNLLSELPVGNGVSMYLQGLLCDVSTLKWQLGVSGTSIKTSDAQVLKLVKWSNLQAAYLHAQHYSLLKWKVFMELCCLQAGSKPTTTSTATESPLPKSNKRKESMISSPPRGSSTRSSNSNSARLIRMATSPSRTKTGGTSELLSGSRFAGDRTSLGMIQVLADVIAARVDLCESGEDDSTLDYFMLVHLRDLVQLLMSMLHHQLRLVVHKARDPKLSQTQQRLDGSETPKLNVQATLALLAIVERAESIVRESLRRLERELQLVQLATTDGDSLMDASPMLETTVPLWTRLVDDFEHKVETLTVEMHTSLLTTALLLVRHASDINGNVSISRQPLRTLDVDMETMEASENGSLLQAKLIAHCMAAISLCDEQSTPSNATRSLFQLSWCLFQEVLDGFASPNVTERPINQRLRMAGAVQLHPVARELEHDQQGLGALFHLLVQRFRSASSSTDKKEVEEKQQQACQVLRGLVAVVWDPRNHELCQRVMLGSSSRLRLLSMLATQLLPLLQTQMSHEETSSEQRGYVMTSLTDADSELELELERSVAHRMWCLVLDFVGGLVRLQSLEDEDEADSGVWEFVAHAEPLLLSAVDSSTCRRLTRAVVEEHQTLLRFVGALSGSSSRRRRWRQAFPTSAVVLMEQSRQLLRRACVLLASSSAETSRLRKEKTQRSKTKSKALSLGMVKSPRSPKSPSAAFSYAHQTLLHEQLRSVLRSEKKHVQRFHREMETQLVDIAKLGSLLLTKWTAALTERDAILVVDGVRYVDEEQLVPLLAFVPPSEARAMASEPSLGHLCLAMEFALDQLLADDEDKEGEEEKKTPNIKARLANAVDTGALLFLKTYLLHAEQYEHAKRDRDEFASFFRKLSARIKDDEAGLSVAVDVKLVEHIAKVVG